MIATPARITQPKRQRIVEPPRSNVRVLVCDGDTRTALATVRSLVAAGHYVWTAAPARSLAGASNGVRSVRVSADPLQSPETYARAIATACDKLAIEVLLPVTDASANAILRFASFLPAQVRVPMSPLRTFRHATDKVAMQTTAAAAGFAVPRAVTLYDASHFETFASEITFPAVLKPHRSVVASGQGPAEHLDVKLIGTADGARRALEQLPPSAFPVMLQERIFGDGEGCFALRWNGKMIACFGHRRLREKPPGGGISVYRESVAVPEAMRVATERLLDDLDWQGVAMIECKKDVRTGQHVFMELNGRLWGSLQLAIDAGVDFPALLVACAVGDEVTPRVPTPFIPGIRSQWFWGEVDHLYARFSKTPEELGLSAHEPDRWKVLLDVIRASLHAYTRNEIGRWDDPGPALLEWMRRLSFSAPKAAPRAPVPVGAAAPRRFPIPDAVLRRMPLRARHD